MSSRPAHDFGVLLNLAFAAFRQALDADLAAAGYDDIGTSFGYVFRRLADGPCSLSELAQELAMTPPGALKVVDDMVAKGYVQRSVDTADRRVKRLHLTERGQAALKRAHQFHQRYEQQLARRLGAEPAAAARAVLEAMVSGEDGARVRRPRPV